MRIAVVRADGSPLVTPLWFIHEDDAIYFTPRAHSEWYGCLKRDPRVALSHRRTTAAVSQGHRRRRSRTGPRSRRRRPLARSLSPHRAPLCAGRRGRGVHPHHHRSTARAVSRARSRRANVRALAHAVGRRARRRHLASTLLRRREPTETQMKSSDLDLRDRAALFAELGAVSFDVAVIGGGITGAGIARDAAMRGLSVALVEARDFAAGTSSRSSKLVHGGIRYLAQGDMALVREAALERKTVRNIAPHLARRTLVHRAGAQPRRLSPSSAPASGPTKNSAASKPTTATSCGHAERLAQEEPALDHRRTLRRDRLSGIRHRRRPPDARQRSQRIAPRRRRRELRRGDGDRLRQRQSQRR